MNAGCIKQAKFMIEQSQKEFMDKKDRQNIHRPAKNACMVLHLGRYFEENVTGPFNFPSGWNQITIENLTASENSFSLFLHPNVGEIPDKELSFEQILSQELPWCLL
ncbi:12125_t:CDS:1, partial [Acaulospora morrowiae]